jgi:hypothetical protein
MKTALLTGLLTATATVAGMIATVAPASAFTWNNNWTQSTITSGFDHTPFQKYVQQERLNLGSASLRKVDYTKLRLKSDYNVSAYFINEGAGYRNQLAYEATSSAGVKSSGLLFDDISSTESIISEANGPLKLGDSVNIGNVAAGTQLDFWLRANGKNGGQNIFGTNTVSNDDGLQHVVAYATGKYVLLGFEDLWGDLGATGGRNEGSDRDFNDSVFILELGEDNVNDLVAVPEPTMTLGLIGVGAAGMVMRRRRQAAEQA